MRPSERRRAILATIATAGEARVDALSCALGVSHETIRRDLSVLADHGEVVKFHGGARARLAAPTSTRSDVPSESPFLQRMAQNTEAKQRIAKRVAALLQPGDSLFIDTGSTTIAVAEAIAALPNLMVITNAPRIATPLASNPQNKVFLIGGAFSPDAGESIGPLALEQIAHFHARYAIVTVGALNTEGISDFDLAEAEIARAMIARAEQVIVVADHEKLGRRAVFDVAPLSHLAMVVTDRAPSADLAAALHSAGVELLIA